MISVESAVEPELPAATVAVMKVVVTSPSMVVRSLPDGTVTAGDGVVVTSEPHCRWIVNE